jgi:hypothetical protein
MIFATSAAISGALGSFELAGAFSCCVMVDNVRLFQNWGKTQARTVMRTPITLREAKTNRID